MKPIPLLGDEERDMIHTVCGLFGASETQDIQQPKPHCLVIQSEPEPPQTIEISVKVGTALMGSDVQEALHLARQNMASVTALAQQTANDASPVLHAAISRHLGNPDAAGMHVKVTPSGNITITPIVPTQEVLLDLLTTMLAVAKDRCDVVIQESAITTAWMVAHPDSTPAICSAYLRILRKRGDKGKRWVRPCGGGRWVVCKSGQHAANGGPENSATIAFLESQWPAIWNRCMRAFPRKLRRSSDMQLIGDHLQQYAVVLLQRDTIGKRAKKGEALPRPAQVSGWAFNNAVTEIRSWGTDASTRSSRGALTGKGYACQGVMYDQDIPFRETFLQNPQVILQGDDGVREDYIGGDAREDMETRIFLEQAMGIIEAALAKTMANPARYIKIARMLVNDDARVTDIANDGGISVARATILRQTIAKKLHAYGVTETLAIHPMKFHDQ